ncbi:hypothetical protein TNCV_2399182 [Trichonephila clavipes]|uniref:Uncharacterized protein n=1 Tax=Trichonephila clavipes TaxID=2585209 RepID=A0A8X6VMC2_TRICX|nr:hypothetical protein TNCV_2399182 [Trichonephila clavipes]
MTGSEGVRYAIAYVLVFNPITSLPVHCTGYRMLVTTDHSSPELMLARKEFTSILSEVFKPSPHSSLSRVSGWQWSASLCSSYIRFVGGGVLPVSKVAGQ